MKKQQLKALVEAALFITDKPLTAIQLKDKLFAEQKIERAKIQKIINELVEDYQERGVNLVKQASGYRFQTNSSLSNQLANLYNEKAPKLSQALMETLAIIAYKQPITRSEIEDIRGVAVSSNIMKTLQERHWVKVIGQKEVPGRPALLGTTPDFLNHFSLASIAQLPKIMPLPDSVSPESITEIETEA